MEVAAGSDGARVATAVVAGLRAGISMAMGVVATNISSRRDRKATENTYGMGDERRRRTRRCILMLKRDIRRLELGSNTLRNMRRRV